MSTKQLAKDIRLNLFGDRGTDLQAAMQYADQVFTSLGESNIAARTAMHVVLNTMANILDAMPVPADNPAAGATAVEEVLIRLIDQRLAARVSSESDFETRVQAEIEDWADNNLDTLIESWIENNLDLSDMVRDEIRNNISFTIEVD